ncbi:MAG: hypothetical protein ACI8V2_002946 [Candidatus Latescibacterota bacterium]|jgi:hypothetical protein
MMVRIMRCNRVERRGLGGSFLPTAYFLSWFAFGDLLLQRRKSRQKVAPQVPGRLIFRKYRWRVQVVVWPTRDGVFKKFSVGWNGAENLDGLILSGLCNTGGRCV